MNKFLFIYEMEYYIAMKISKLQLYSTALIYLTDPVISEINSERKG